MLFPTVAFAVFFIAAFTVNWLLRPHHLVWRATMIAVSLYFCGWLDVRFAVLAVGSAAVNWALAVAAHRALAGGDPTVESRRWVRLAVIVDVAVLALFAYRGFLVDSVTGTLEGVGLSPPTPVLGLLVPLGLSIFTLHAISYVVDVGRGDVEPVTFGDVLLYLVFFPHLVAGPVVRVDELVPQFHEQPDPRRVAATDAFALIGVGLFKTVVVAGYLGAEVVDPAFADPGAVGGVALLVAAWAVAVQVYAGLSGVTDIAIGCALLLGVRYPDAFESPYRALSVREFWDRWNMTVSRWLRDYVYIPLGGSRDGVPATYRNLMATMVLGGLWYGAGWTFAVWGALHGAYLVGERFVWSWWDARHGDRAAAADDGPGPVSAVLRWVITVNLVSLAWVFFRADSVGTGIEIVGRIATLAPGSTDVVTGLALVTLAAVLASQLVTEHRTYELRTRFSALGPAAQVVVLAAGLTLVSVLGPDGGPPFGYLPF
jgi:D-alanyl-lipoteichoic acid acyltransferase DltB (MBOAT superfamily)